MDNYIYIDGVKVLLNDSQISELRATLEKKVETKKEKSSPFERQSYNTYYYYIGGAGDVYPSNDLHTDSDSACYNVANYCTDEGLLRQRGLEEILARRLWRYSMEHDGDKIDWSDGQCKYVICYDVVAGVFYIVHDIICQSINMIYFIDFATAQKAIEEVVKPFMEEYPGFKNYRTCSARGEKGE